MSTPRTVQLANGVEISLDRTQTEDGQPLLQFVIHDPRYLQGVIADLNMAEVAQLHAHLDEWLRQRR